MKKVFVLSVALILCVLSIFVGCSSKEGKGDDTTKETTAATTTADTTADTTDDATTTVEDTSGDSGAALSAFVKEQQAALDAQSVQGLAVTCSARGNSIAYSYKYDIEMDKATAQASLDLLDSTYDALLTTMKEVIPECESIVVEILNQSGDVLATKEYK